MIFITAGTTSFPFERLEKIVLNVYHKFPTQRIVYQSTIPPATKLPKHVRWVKAMSATEFINALKEADIIIAHAGYGTVMQILRYSKTVPQVIPRLRQFNEHVNDHQKFFADYMSRKGVIKILDSQNKLDGVKLNDLQNNLRVNKYITATELKKELLINYLRKTTTNYV